MFIGIDQSLTATGVATTYVKPNLKLGVNASELRPPQKITTLQRLVWFRDQITKVIASGGNTIILSAMEGYSYGSKFSHSHALGELGGVIKLCHWQAGVNFIVVPPNSLKKFVTGKGTSTKSVMIREVYKRWGVEVESDNEADAVGLLKMAQAYHAISVGLEHDLTEFQKDAIAKVEFVETRKKPLMVKS